MGGFGPLATSLGFFLRGQRQGEQAQSLEALKAQILRRQALASTKQILQMPDGTFKIVDLADPNVAGTLGTGVDYAKRLQSMIDSGALPDSLKGLATSAIKSGDTAYQAQLYDSALKLIGSPTFEKTNLNPSEKKQAITEALQTNVPPALRPLLMRAVAPDASPALVDAAYKELIPAFGSSLYAPHIFPYTATDPNTGLSTVTPYRSEGREGTASPVMTGAPAPTSTGGADPSGGLRPLTSAKPIPAADQKLIGTVQGLLPQLSDLKAKLQEIGPERWNRDLLSRNLGYAKQKYGKVAASTDSDIAKLTSKLIQVEATANAALAASAGTRAFGFIQHSEGHIPSGRGDFNYNMNAIDTLTDPNGPYLPTLKLYGINPAGTTTTDPTGKPIAGGVSLPSDAIPLGGGRYYSPSTAKSYEVSP